ncbi:RING/U-box protein, putative isoform 1 [Hibiscus syriacus]|uniref:1-phosphatidylinositol 4-kinase n=1 Tax=Hibiscus syriacus TaxID=106335 RepID=A0A6A3ARV9_HIBSY|nr:RING/U-box protein, putative isoform 1 [Hibiscus syriacus]
MEISPTAMENRINLPFGSPLLRVTSLASPSSSIPLLWLTVHTPVRTQMAVAVSNGAMELQIVINVPTDEISLTFGDLTLDNDLRAIRNDSPLLLTRNVMHRSSSTPCPSGKNLQQRDRSSLIEILGCSARSVELLGLNVKGENIAIVKPTDEESFAPNNPKGFIEKTLGQPALKHSVRVGETGFREEYWMLGSLTPTGMWEPLELIPIDHGLFLRESLEDPMLHLDCVLLKLVNDEQFHVQQEPSELEVICFEAKDLLSSSDETVEESEIRVDEDPFRTASRLSPSKKVNLCEKGFHYHGGKQEGNYTMGYSYSSRMSRSANE